MPLDLANYAAETREAVSAFWLSRDDAKRKQLESGKADQGERAGVTGGKNMDRFARLIAQIVRRNGLSQAQILYDKAALTLPGYFRPTKSWDILVMHEGQLIAAIELKSHVGPSFGNNFNNRAEEAIGTAHCLQTALREEAFGKQPRPFIGWLMVVEDVEGSRAPVRDRSPHFPTLEEFNGASYLKRYDILCQRLMQEQLYTAAALIATPRQAVATGEYVSLSDLTSFKSFVTSLAGHVAITAAQLDLS